MGRLDSTPFLSFTRDASLSLSTPFHSVLLCWPGPFACPARVSTVWALRVKFLPQFMKREQKASLLPTGGRSRRLLRVATAQLLPCHTHTHSHLHLPLAVHTQCLVPRAAASYQLSATWCRCSLPVAGCPLPVSVTHPSWFARPSIFLPATHEIKGYFNFVPSLFASTNYIYSYIPSSALTMAKSCLFWFIPIKLYLSVWTP